MSINIVYASLEGDSAQQFIYYTSTDDDEQSIELFKEYLVNEGYEVDNIQEDYENFTNFSININRLKFNITLMYIDESQPLQTPNEE